MMHAFLGKLLDILGDVLDSIAPRPQPERKPIPVRADTRPRR